MSVSNAPLINLQKKNINSISRNFNSRKNNRLYKKSKTNAQPNAQPNNTLKRLDDTVIESKEPFNLEDSLFKFFQILPIHQPYFIESMKDALSLYTTIDWINADNLTTNRNPKTKKNNTSKNTNNITEKPTYDILDKYKERAKKYKFNISNFESENKTFNKDSEVLSSYTKNKYKFIESLNIDYKPNKKTFKDHLPTYRLIIYQNMDNENYLILFLYGSSINFYDESANYNNTPPSKIIKIFLNFIKKNIIDKNANILLFGHSMGANIAQHIFVNLEKETDNKYTQLFMITSGTSNNLNQSDCDIINSKLGKFISFGLFSKDKDKITIDQFLLMGPKSKLLTTLLTIKTLVLEIDNLQNIISILDLAILQSNNSLSKSLQLHDFKIIRHALIQTFNS